MQFNFSQHIQDGDDLGAYDYGSIMHYPRTAFSINGQDTVVAKHALPPGVVMGQRSALSAGDIAGVHAMYPGATLKEVPKDPVTDTIKEIRKVLVLYRRRAGDEVCGSAETGTPDRLRYSDLKEAVRNAGC